MYWKQLTAYVIAFTIGIIIMVYFLDIPTFITQNPKIVHNYYITHAYPNILLDLFFVFAYLLVATGIIKYSKTDKNFHKFIIVIITTLIITSAWCLYFRSKPKSNAFFSQWFHSVGYSSAIYDAILIGFIYLIYERILDLL